MSSESGGMGAERSVPLTQPHHLQHVLDGVHLGRRGRALRGGGWAREGTVPSEVAYKLWAISTVHKNSLISEMPQTVLWFSREHKLKPVKCPKKILEPVEKCPSPDKFNSLVHLLHEGADLQAVLVVGVHQDGRARGGGCGCVRRLPVALRERHLRQGQSVLKLCGWSIFTAKHYNVEFLLLL